MSELTRHRLASFSIASTRYIDYTKKDMKFILPVKFNSPDPSREEIRQFVIWKRSCSQSEENYIEMMKLGASPQEARACLNNSLLTTIAMTANIRELRHIIELRTASGAHPQMIDLIKKLHNKLKEFIPIVFDDL
jgi:thymidylate synthase (FAD)